MKCDARQERGVLLSRVSHKDHVDVVEGPCLHQVDLSSNILLGWSAKNCYLESNVDIHNHTVIIINNKHFQK